MLKRLFLGLAGTALAVLGVVGLLVPVMPGLLFLAAAAGCFSLASRRVKTVLESRLGRHPRYRRTLRGWYLGRHLPVWRRAQLAFWIALGSVVPGRQR